MNQKMFYDALAGTMQALSIAFIVGCFTMSLAIWVWYCETNFL